MENNLKTEFKREEVKSKIKTAYNPEVDLGKDFQGAEFEDYPY